MPLVYDITVQLPCFEADVDVGAGPVPLDPPEEPLDDPPEVPEEPDVPEDPPDDPDEPFDPLLPLVPELVPPPSSPPPLLVPPDEFPELAPDDALPELAPPELYPPLEPPPEEPRPPRLVLAGELLHATAPPTSPSKQGTKTRAPLGSLDPRDESFDMTFHSPNGGRDRPNESVSREGPRGNATAVSCWLKMVIPWLDKVTGQGTELRTRTGRKSPVSPPPKNHAHAIPFSTSTLQAWTSTP